MRTTISQVVLGLSALLGLAGTRLSAQQAPKDLKLTIVSPTKVSMTWTAGTNATGHRILRGVGTAAPALIGYVQSPGTLYTDAGAPAGTQLVYQVMAKYPNSPNAYSAKVSVTTPSAGSTASSTPPPASSPPATQPAATPAAPSSATAVPSSPVVATVPVAARQYGCTSVRRYPGCRDDRQAQSRCGRRSHAGRDSGTGHPSRLCCPHAGQWTLSGRGQRVQRDPRIV